MRRTWRCREPHARSEPFFEGRTGWMTSFNKPISRSTLRRKEPSKRMSTLRASNALRALATRRSMSLKVDWLAIVSGHNMPDATSLVHDRRVESTHLKELRRARRNVSRRPILQTRPRSSLEQRSPSDARSLWRARRAGTNAAPRRVLRSLTTRVGWVRSARLALGQFRHVLEGQLTFELS